MDKQLPVIIVLSVLLVLSVIIGLIFLKVQEKNRFFQKKGFYTFLFVSSLIFGLFGFLAMNGSWSISQRFTNLSILFSVAGVLHVWLLFTNNTWSDRKSFLPENLYTLLLGTLGAFAFGLSYWLIGTYLGSLKQMSLLLLISCLFFLPPYLFFRTYDLLFLIPQKMFYAWTVPDVQPISFNFSKEQIIEINLIVKRRSLTTKNSFPIKERRFLPKSFSFGQFFQRFLVDYNKEHPDQPLEHFKADPKDRPIGWIFYCHNLSNNKQYQIDPDAPGDTQIKAEDTVLAYRVLLDKDAKPRIETDKIKKSNSPKEDEIIIDEIGDNADGKSKFDVDDDDIEFSEI